MKHSPHFSVAVLAAAVSFFALFFAACEPADKTISVSTPEPTPTLAPTVTPEPTPEPTPAPRVIEVQLNQEMRGIDNTKIIAKKLTYIQGQSISIDVSIDNSGYDCYFDFPIYATINGWGIVLYPSIPSNELRIASQYEQTDIALGAKLDESIDQLMNITEIQSVFIEETFDVLIRFKTRVMTDVFINPDCPADYVQDYPEIDENSIPVSDGNTRAYIESELNDFFFITEEKYDYNAQKLYFVVKGEPIQKPSDISKPNYGRAYLAIDGLMEEEGFAFYLPNDGYCVLTFDLKNHPDFDPAKQQHALSFNATRDTSYISGGYLYADLTPEDIKQDFQPTFDFAGGIWADTPKYKIVYLGIDTYTCYPYEYGVYAYQQPCLKFFFMNYDQDVRTLYVRDFSINGVDNDKAFRCVPIPPMCGGVIRLPADEFDMPSGMTSLDQGKVAIEFALLAPGGYVEDTINGTVLPTK